jgi:hypothetical protein
MHQRQVRETQHVWLLRAFTQRGCSMFRRARFHLPVEFLLPRKIETWLDVEPFLSLLPTLILNFNHSVHIFRLTQKAWTQHIRPTHG